MNNTTPMVCAPRLPPSNRPLCGAVLALALALTLSACGTDRGSRGREIERDAMDRPGSPIASLRFIGEQRIPWKQGFEGTTVGGLSGLDYDVRTDTWVMQSDDRSSINPARFYTARLRFNAEKFEAVNLNGVYFFKQADGSTYPNEAAFAQQRGGDVPDIEAIRFDPLDGSLWYSSEGDVKLGLDPFIRHARRDGRYIEALPLPAMFKVAKVARSMPNAPSRPPAAATSGVRDNLSFEGISFAPDGQSLWVATEGPLVQDGPVPTATSAGADTRITEYDRSGKVLFQVAYTLDPVPRAPAKDMAADNGISEILSINAHQMFVVERAGVQGADKLYQNFIRIYELDTRGATDVSGLASLRGASYTPARKRLVLDLNTLGLPQLDNIEAISWGPRLANGHDSLVLMSDDNFSKNEVTQFLLFEVMPTYERWRLKNPLPGLKQYFDKW